MLKLASQLKDLPIFSLRDGKQIAAIESILVDPDNGKFLAVVAEKPGWLQAAKVVSAQDLREITSEMAIVDSEDVITSPDEIIRVAELLKTKFELEKRSVKSESGQSLGSLNDYAIELSTSSLLRLYVKSRLAKELVINWLDIIRIEPNQIIVRDLTVSEPAKAVPLPNVLGKITPPAPNASKISSQSR